MMPRDVATRWNLTYNMLMFALEYCEAIDGITGDRDMQKYELSEEEWKLVQQLCDILVVRHFIAFQFLEQMSSPIPRYLKTQPFSFHVQHQILPL